MKTIKYAVVLSVLLMAFFFISAASAQEEQLTLSLSRDWGYGGFGGDIQGLFSMRVRGPETLVKVEFYIDETKVNEDAEPPFRYQFTTDDYPLGWHTLYAVGVTSDGRQLRSNELHANFVPASEGTKAAGKFIGPILAVAAAATLLSFIVPMLGGRKSLQTPLGAERKYGFSGGAICPRCHRPFPLPLFAPNLGFSKLARCPYCGKVGAMRAETLAKLREAEKAELTWAQAEAPQVSEEEKLRKELDDSKYQGM